MIRAKKKYTDEQLIKGCRENKRRYQEALYRQHFAPMMSMIMRYSQDRETALTICNDGFLKVFQKIDSYQGKGSFQGWIRRIVYHAMSDFFRKESKYIQFMVFDDFERSTSSEALPELFLEDLLQMVQRLPTMTEKVFKLYAVEGFNHREVGEELGMSENTSKWHLANARKKLKEMLNSQDEAYVSRNG